MAANKGDLSVKRIERLNRPGRYADGRGLYLQVVNANNRSWLLRYQRDGREHWMGLGACGRNVRFRQLRTCRERTLWQQRAISTHYRSAILAAASPQ